MANNAHIVFTPTINIGETVNNTRIVDEFQCSPQSGMRRSTKTNTLVLVSKHVVSTSKVYDDKVIGGVYHYTGQGLKGDQSLSYGQNKTLAESNTNNVDLHFFEVFKDGEYIYQGKIRLTGIPYQATQDDEEGNPRQVWIFPLQLVGTSNSFGYIEEELVTEVYEDQVKIAVRLDIEELKIRAIKSGSPASSRNTSSKTYIRSPYIAEFTKKQANGVCQLCNQPAPFIDRRGEPYLESHHLVWLSKNGPDRIENTVALCPNCHKRMHIRNDKSDIEELSALKKIS